MYLSRVRINKEIRTSMKFLGSLQVMHAAVEGCFAAGDTSRKLWRLDYFHGQPYILVFSQEKPDFAHLAEQFGYAGDVGEIRDCQNLFQMLANGQRYRFRLCGNPVHSIKEGNRERGKVVPHVTVPQQEDWFRAKSETAGFLPESFAVVRRDIKKFTRKGKLVTLHTAVFEGILQITDAESFRRTLCAGIGRAKSYGCGLLTLGRV